MSKKRVDLNKDLKDTGYPSNVGNFNNGLSSAYSQPNPPQPSNNPNQPSVNQAAYIHGNGSSYAEPMLNNDITQTASQEESTEKKKHGFMFFHKKEANAKDLTSVPPAPSNPPYIAADLGKHAMKHAGQGAKQKKVHLDPAIRKAKRIKGWKIAFSVTLISILMFLVVYIVISILALSGVIQ